MENTSVSASLVELLEDFIQQHHVTIPDATLQTIHAFHGKKRMPMQTWLMLLEQVQQAYPIPALGVQIGQCIQPHHVGVLGYLALSSPNFYSFCMCFRHFQPLLQTAARFSIEVHGDDLCLSWDGRADRAFELANENMISGLVTSAKKILGMTGSAPSLIEFTSKTPIDTDIYTTLLGCPVRFESDQLRIWVSMSIMTTPINTSDPRLKFLLDQQAETLLLALPNPDPLLSNIQRAIVDTLKDGEPTAAQIAIRLHYSLRTLFITHIISTAC